MSITRTHVHPNNHLTRERVNVESHSLAASPLYMYLHISHRVYTHLLPHLDRLKYHFHNSGGLASARRAMDDGYIRSGQGKHHSTTLAHIKCRVHKRECKRCLVRMERVYRETQFAQKEPLHTYHHGRLCFECMVKTLCFQVLKTIAFLGAKHNMHVLHSDIVLLKNFEIL